MNKINLHPSNKHRLQEKASDYWNIAKPKEFYFTQWKKATYEFLPNVRKLFLINTFCEKLGWL